MAESDEEDFHFWGTRIADEEETRAGQHRKDVRDAAATRALPLHKQEVTDEEGRRRFHGAFTGGWSAGYYNTVGSKEGWQPGEFRSSRGARAAVQQSVEQYLDEDELEELRRTNLQTTQEYDTFGSTAAELARRAAAEAAAERPSAIPGLLPDEVVAPVAEGVGIRLLQKMGWRQGKGIGTAGAGPAQEEGAGEGGRPRRRWGQHATVAAENTQLYLLAPKTDVHGLGFDPFKGAEDFRRLKEQAREAARPKAAGEGRKRRRGIAFGSGVLDEEDGYGEGATMEDYVTHGDVEDYEGTVQDDGLPRSRAPRVQRSGLGDRLAAKGYSFEIMDEEEVEQGMLGWSGHERQQRYALPGREAPLMLQSREQQVKNSLIPGFVLATTTVTFAYFPPPRLPPGYVPLHHPGRQGAAAAPAAADQSAPPKAEPPVDAELRQAIDSLAFFVAKNGVIFENMARQRQQKEGRWPFLSGGEGAAYYRWKVHSLKSIIRPQQKRQQPRVIGQRSAPLSADERGALLGEQPLPATQQGWAAGVTGAPVQAAAGAELPQALRRQLMNVAEADRMRLQQMLSRNFVSAESKEMLQPGTEAEAVAGLRPGAPAPAPRAPVTMAAGGIGKVVTEADLARPVEASAAAVGGRGLALQPAAAAGAGAAKRLPVRRVEEWRPAALLCKRFNVPDPYLGRPAELQMSRFKTDHLVLPDTAAAVAASLSAVPSGAQDFLLPPTVAAALAEAEAKQLQQAGPQAPAGKPPAAPPALPSAQAAAMAQQAQVQQPQDAAGAADAFLSSLSDMLGGSGEAAPAAAEVAPPLPLGPPPEQPPEDAVAAAEAAAERPVDLFKAIFEDSDEEEELEEPPQPPQPPAAGQAPEPSQQAPPGQPPLPPGPPPSQQQQQQQPDEPAFGFAKLRQPAPPPLPAGPPPPLPVGQALPGAAGAAAAAAAAGAAAGIDEAMKQRVQEALRALKKDKKDKRGSKKKKKKQKKEKRGKERSRKHKKESKERRRKEEWRRGGGGSDSSSGSSSDSDSDRD